jgi:5'-methylthioadenosine phosphorylase
MYRGLDASIIGMTNLTEAKLAREAEICYGIIALSTDYDCWHNSHEDVTVEAIIKIIHQNVAMAKNIIRHAVIGIAAERSCPCATAMQYAVITDKKTIPVKTKADLDIIVGRYL